MLRAAAVIAVIGSLVGVDSTAIGRHAPGAGVCANLRQAAQTPGMVRKGWLGGDVTGDGVRDRVAVVEDRRAPFRCRFAVGVFSRGRILLYPLGRFLDKPTEAIGQPWPLIRLLARIDSRPGAEILVAVSHGASFEQARLLTLRAGRLQRLWFPGAYRGQLDYGSVAAFGTNFDCRGRSSSVILRASYWVLDSAGRRWRYVLTRYRVTAGGIRAEATRAATVRGVVTGRPRWWTRYYSEREPFRRCSIAKQSSPN